MDGLLGCIGCIVEAPLEDLKSVVVQGVGAHSKTRWKRWELARRVADE